jgi:glycerol kinase
LELGLRISDFEFPTMILALDQSTSATKAILFDEHGRAVAQASREHQQIYPRPGWVEHDAGEIWQNTLEAIRELTQVQSDCLASISGVSITNQRETILVFDRKSGEPLANAIVWQDRRGDPLCADLKQDGNDAWVRDKTGLKIDTYFSASKLKWLIANRPDIAAKLRSGEAVIGTIDAYLVHRLTAGSVFACDHTNASRTLLYDIGRLQWDDELCALFDVPASALPEVRESFAQFGETDLEGLLPHPVPICGIMGDSQASLFAQRCYQPGMAKATFGTGTSVLLNIGSSWKLSEQGAVSALAWVHQGQPTYAFEGLINYSAATLAWLRDQLGLIRDPAESETLARAVDDNGGVYLVPAFAGLSAPYWSADARAAIVGMTAFTRKEHIVRAALESISYQIRDVLDMMRPDAGVRLQALHADGGPTRNEFLMQFTADITGVELKVSDVAESSALGATMAGLLGLSVYRSFDDLTTLPRDSRSYSPSLEETVVRQQHDGWRAAVKRVL